MNIIHSCSSVCSNRHLNHRRKLEPRQRCQSLKSPALKMSINQHSSQARLPHREPYTSKSPPSSPKPFMHDPATTFYTPVTSPAREGWLAPPTSPTRVVRDPIACAQQSIASEFDAQRRRIQELESEVRSMRLALEDHFNSRPPQPVARTEPAPSHMPISPGLASASARSTGSRPGSSRTSMGQEDFFKLFLPMKTRVGPTGGLVATAAASNGVAVTEGTRQSTRKLRLSREPGGGAPSTPKEGNAGPLSSTSRAKGTGAEDTERRGRLGAGSVDAWLKRTLSVRATEQP